MTFWKALMVHFLVFTLIAVYWVFEAVMLAVWISFGVGTSYSTSYMSKLITSQKLTNAWETYITIYVVACGVFCQTSFHLMFWEQVLMTVKGKAEIPYQLYRIWPLRLLIIVSFYELFLQFRIRFGEELADEEENLVTLRFLLATCFVGYSLGRKCRQDFRMNEAEIVPFVCPGLIKYCAMFSIFYVLEIVLLFVWGFPLVLLAFGFRYYFFQEHLVYFGLLFVGVLVGIATAGMERGYRYWGPFRAEPMMPSIYAEVKANVMLFTILPLMTRWYFRIQLQYPDYSESNKVNFILFSVNVSFLLMYFVKQVLHYKYKAEDEVRGRMITGELYVPDPEVLDPININDANNNEAEAGENDTSSLSTGNFSWRSTSSGSEQCDHYNITKNGSYCNNAPYSFTTTFSTGQPRIILEPEIRIDKMDTINQAVQTQQHRTEVTTATSSHGGSGGNAVDVMGTNFETNNNIQAPGFPLLLTPLRNSLGILNIDKRWRDQMLNPGYIKRLSYSRNSSRIPIPVTAAFMNLRSRVHAPNVRQSLSPMPTQQSNQCQSSAIRVDTDNTNSQLHDINNQGKRKYPLKDTEIV